MNSKEEVINIIDPAKIKCAGCKKWFNKSEVKELKKFFIDGGWECDKCFFRMWHERFGREFDYYYKRVDWR